MQTFPGFFQWAFNYLANSAFATFAASTSCSRKKCLTSCKEQLGHLVMEGTVLKKLSTVPLKATNVHEAETVEIIDVEHVKKKL